MRLLIALLLLLAPPVARADGDDDWEAARRAVEENRALPLSTIAPTVEARFAARLIDAELEEEDGRIVYELKLITGGGQLMEVYVDAATGTVIKSEGAD